MSVWSKRLAGLGVAVGIFMGIGARSTLAAEVQWARVGTSGKTIIVQFKDAGSVEQAYVKDVVSSPVITINGSDTITLADPIFTKLVIRGKVTTGLPYVIFALSSKVITPQDKVTISAPANWAQCVGGSIAEMKGLAVENYAGQSLLPPPPKTYTMGVGFDLSPEGWGPIMFRANLFQQTPRNKCWANGNGNLIDPPLQSNGLPTAMGDKGLELRLGSSPCASGNYTLMWDGKDQLSMENASMKLTTDHLTGGADNTRVYAISKPLNGGWLWVKFSGLDVHNLRLYPPGVKTDGSEYFNPEFLRMLRGAQIIRFMPALNAWNTTLVSFKDLRRDDVEVHRMPESPILKLVKIEPYDNKNLFFPSWDKRVFAKFTTAEPHGLKTGQMVFIQSDDSVELTDNSTCKLTRFTKYMVYVLSPTEFAISGRAYSTGLVTLKSAKAISGTAQAMTEQCDMSLKEMVDLCNTVGSDMWLSVPPLFDDDSIRKMMEYVGKGLDKGRKVHLEYANETWNWSFPSTYYCIGNGSIATDPKIVKETKNLADKQTTQGLRWYVKRSSQVWAIGRDVFDKQGRPNDIIGAINVIRFCIPMYLDFAKSDGITVDEIAYAPYWYLDRDWTPARHAAAKADKATANLDVDQICDCADMKLLFDHGGTGIRNMLKDLDFKGKLVAYEAGPEQAVYQSMDGVYAGKINISWLRNPRMASWLRYYLQSQQVQERYSALVAFTLNEAYVTPEQFPDHVDPYAPIYTSRDCLDGKGDGSDGRFDNRKDFLSPECVSVLGYAYHDWIDHVRKDPAPPTEGENNRSFSNE